MVTDMTLSSEEKSTLFSAPNFSYFRQRDGGFGIISLVICVTVSGVIGFSLHHFLMVRQIGAEIFLAPETAGLLAGSLLLCLGLLGREMLLRYRAEREFRRQLNLVSNNLARLTRRVGLDPVSESGRGEASLTSLVSELRELRSMVLALHGVRGAGKLPPKTPRDAEWGAEPLGLETPTRSVRPDIAQGNSLTGNKSTGKSNFTNASSQKKSTPAASSIQTDLPSFLKATKSDRVVNLSEDNGQDIVKPRGLHDVSLDPIMAVANAPNMALESLRQALAQDQVQIFLEPILSLPHRRLAFSRVSSHIVFDDKQILSPINYRDLASDAGLMGAIDNMSLSRVVQRIRRLRRGRQVTPLFCPISAGTLQERDLFNDFRVFLRSNAELASHVIFSFRQYDLERIDSRTEGDLIELNRFGFRYSVEDVTNVDLFCRRLCTSRH